MYAKLYQPEGEVVLENLVDTFGLRETVSMLASVCRHKADHLTMNWQDYGAAETWEGKANRLEALARRLMRDEARG